MDMTELLLGLLLENTYLILTLGVFVGALGLPLPTTLLIIAAGAFAAQGFADFGIIVAIVAITAAIGDSIGYFLGGKIGLFQHKLPKFAQKILNSGRSQFSGCSGRMIFLSRFLFTAIGTPINLLSGIYSCSYRRFIPFVTGGELVWAIEMTAIGYWFGANIEMVYEFIGNISAIAVILLGIYVVGKRIR